jgi:hypothetical protein
VWTATQDDVISDKRNNLLNASFIDASVTSFNAMTTSSLLNDESIFKSFRFVNYSEPVKYSDQKYDSLPVIDADIVEESEPVEQNNRSLLSFTKRVLIYSRDVVTLKPLRTRLSGIGAKALASEAEASQPFPLTESKPGVYQYAQLIVRRRLLSLLDRSHPWAKAVSRDDRIAKYYNSPSYRQDLQSNRFIKAKAAPINPASKWEIIQDGISTAVGKINPFRPADSDALDASAMQRIPSSSSELNIFRAKRPSKSSNTYDSTAKQLPAEVRNPINFVGQRFQALRVGISKGVQNLVDEIPIIREGVESLPELISNSPPIASARGVGKAISRTASEILKVGEEFRELDVPHILSRDRKVPTSIANDSSSPSLDEPNRYASEQENLVSSIMITEESPPERINTEEVKPSVVKSSPTAMMLTASSKLLFVAFPISSRVAKLVLQSVNPQLSTKPSAAVSSSSNYYTPAGPDASYNIPAYSTDIDKNVFESMAAPSSDIAIETTKVANTNANADGNQAFAFFSSAVSTISGAVSAIPWPKSSSSDDRQVDSANPLDDAALVEYNPIESLQQRFNVPFPLLTSNQALPNANRSTMIPLSKLDDALSSTAAGSKDRAAFKESATSSLPSISIDGSVNFRVGRSQELRSRPTFIDRDGVPLPTKIDFALINSRRVTVAVAAALAVKSEQDAKEYLREIGMKPLLTAVLNPIRPEIRVDAILGICRLMRQEKSVAAKVAAVPGFLAVLCDLIELPLRGFLSFKSPQERDKDLRAQFEAVALVKRMVRSSDEALVVMRNDQRLKKVLSSVVAQGELAATGSKLMNSSTNSMRSSSGALAMGSTTASVTAIKRKLNNPTIVDLNDLKTHEMARVAAWGLGGVPWKPKQPGQKGLRILSFDGGGTRGVLSIALLKELMLRVGKSSPFEMFDIICGTSTGGIIAGLLGIIRTRVDESESMYDELIDKVFGSKSNLKLVTEQAFYDEVEFENILYRLCGDELMLDSNQNECPRVFFVSTKVNVNPPQIQLWRNYNYPLGQNSRYSGEFRVNTRMAVRATTAAPTFFTPVQFEGGLYCDGALVANNPTAIALQEAKVIAPSSSSMSDL